MCSYGGNGEVAAESGSLSWKDEQRRRVSSRPAPIAPERPSVKPDCATPGRGTPQPNKKNRSWMQDHPGAADLFFDSRPRASVRPPSALEDFRTQTRALVATNIRRPTSARQKFGAASFFPTLSKRENPTATTGRYSQPRGMSHRRDRDTGRRVRILWWALRMQEHGASLFQTTHRTTESRRTPASISLTPESLDPSAHNFKLRRRTVTTRNTRPEGLR